MRLVVSRQLSVVGCQRSVASIIDDFKFLTENGRLIIKN